MTALRPAYTGTNIRSPANGPIRIRTNMGAAWTLVRGGEFSGTIIRCLANGPIRIRTNIGVAWILVRVGGISELTSALLRANL